MGFATTLGAAALASAAAAIAALPAAAMPLPAAPAVTADNAAMAVSTIGYRRQYNGISYVGDYGLQYAPNYYFHRHHGNDVYVKIIIKPETEETPRRHTRPLIIDLD